MDHPGWAAIVNFSILLGQDSLNLHAGHVDWHAYLASLAGHGILALYKDPRFVMALGFLCHAAWWWLVAGGRVLPPGRLPVAAAASTASVLGHVLLFPVVWDRFFAASYAVGMISLLAAQRSPTMSRQASGAAGAMPRARPATALSAGIMPLVRRDLADSRVEVIHHPANRGHIATYNEGIAWAAAEYFLLLSADDLLVPGALGRAMALMDARPDVSFTYGKDHVLDADGGSWPMAAANEDAGWRIRSGEAFIAHVCHSAGNPVPACTAIVRTAAQKQAGPYRAHLPHAGDLEMWLRLARLGAVAATDTVQGIRRLHGANMSDAYVRRMIQEFRQREAAFDSFFAGADRFLPDAKGLRRQTRGGLATQACRFGLSYLRKGHVGQGAELLRYALALDPLAATATPLVYLERVLDGHFGPGTRLPQPRR